ncbi:hypothetical protein [Methylobacterium sp. WL19]|uniref:structural cement protein Gp24 n=1 Tax=Methylobacterium sp. WL19 TaxID=2603896 RepID=UPI0011CA5EDB|nr:hypothetical protein [Methylobacterium sp. WL19]TXN33908.1 hypothetical protein FV220_00210 [Methylobacterium sp. WL19]
MGFPASVSYAPAPAVEGDFCDANPRSTVNAGSGGLVVGAAGVQVGRFAWAAAPNDANGAPATVTNAGSGAPTGFVHRELQGLNTVFLSESTNLVPAGFAITLFKSGGFWVINRGAAAATINQKAFASNTDGSVAFAAAGATVAGFTETKWICMSPGAVGTLIKISSQPNG